MAPPETVAALLALARERLAHSSPTAALDARLLLAHALGKQESFLYTWPEHVPTEAQARQFHEWLARRSAGTPVAYLIGRQGFYGHEFLVSPETLIPRPDTELLVETTLALLPQQHEDGHEQVRVADLGTGTGAVAISLALARPRWAVLALDFSSAVLDLAERNARRLGATNVQVRQSDWYRDLPGQYHALISNPPYIRDDDLHLQQGDVRFEPRSALTSGMDGLDDIRTLIRGAPAHLLPQGWLLLEHGYDQGAAVRALLQEHGFHAVATRQDLAGHDRVTLGCWAGRQHAQ